MGPHPSPPWGGATLPSWWLRKTEWLTWGCSTEPGSSRPSCMLRGSAPYAFEGRQGASLHPVLNASTDSHIPHVSPGISRTANHSTCLLIPHSRCCSYYRHFIVESTES